MDLEQAKKASKIKAEDDDSARFLLTGPGLSPASVLNDALSKFTPSISDQYLYTTGTSSLEL
jgi:hypothetical protein